jgi:hypothetical protein
MKKNIVLSSFIFLIFLTNSGMAFSDPATTAAVLQLNATEISAHLKELAQAIQQVQLLQSELSNAQGLLQLAQQSAIGVDGLQTLGSFQNVILSANSVINSANNYINTTQNMPQQWQSLFGSLDSWGPNTKDLYGNMNVSDSINTSGYLIGDSYQQLYNQNAATVSQYLANATQVSDKGALKQIAEESAQLIQMENNVIYLLSQLLKGQSIESSNDNLKRKNDAVAYDQENQGVTNFMNTVNTQTFGI